MKNLTKAFILILSFSFVFPAPSFAQNKSAQNETSDSKWLIVTVPTANIRAGGSMKDKVIFQLPQGRIIRVLKEVGEWYMVQDQVLYLIGFVHKSVVELIPDYKGSKISEEVPVEIDIVKIEPKAEEPITKPAPTQIQSGAQRYVPSPRTALVEWQARLDLAKKKRTKGLRIGLAGVSVGLLSPMFVGESEKAAVTMTMLGAGASLYGMYIWYTGNRDVNNLNQEGRAKGYLTFGPTPDGGVRVGYTLSF